MITTSSSRLRLAIVLASLGVLLAVLAAVGIYGLLATPETDEQSPPIRSAPAADRRISQQVEDREEHKEVLSWQDLPALPQTDNPIRYARAAANSLFAWDTMSGLSPQDYTNPVLVDADPSGLETNGVISDLKNYLPAEDVWLQLREYETTQRLAIDNAYIPESWTQIFQDNSSRLAAGTVAVTIEGTRHRNGRWLGRPQSSAHEVAFTVFLACPPAHDRCHTLRLSQPDKPLR